ncbi:hypothetical protein BS47DRAFT_1398577 [Hydnum rufescens UP504]|uniref:Uncharacterized protein n=1 Tax=Hydnum rufescens UP504 TaxID=1448309 RepID=A0A9P6AKH0_9AGAM|nr:hypothetical protein BS47DRAFT_1398577 [Hydnum rufescens UP504]
MLCYSIRDRIDDGTLEKLCDAKDTRKLLGQYCSQAGQELTRHQLFAKDPTPILGSAAERKIDIILVFSYSALLDSGTELSWTFIGMMYVVPLNSRSKVKEAERTGEALTSSSHSLSATSHRYDSDTAEWQTGSVSTEGSRKRAASGPFVGQPQGKKPGQTADHTNER